MRLGGPVYDYQSADEWIARLDVVPPGQGQLDYPALLQCATALDHDLPHLLEHFQPAQYPPAAAFLRATAQSLGAKL